MKPTVATCGLLLAAQLSVTTHGTFPTELRQLEATLKRPPGGHE